MIRCKKCFATVDTYFCRQDKIKNFLKLNSTISEMLARSGSFTHFLKSILNHWKFKNWQMFIRETFTDKTTWKRRLENKINENTENEISHQNFKTYCSHHSRGICFEIKTELNKISFWSLKTRKTAWFDSILSVNIFYVVNPSKIHFFDIDAGSIRKNFFAVSNQNHRQIHWYSTSGKNRKYPEWCIREHATMLQLTETEKFLVKIVFEKKLWNGSFIFSPILSTGFSKLHVHISV